MNVRIRPIKFRGRTKSVPAKQADALVRLGLYAYADDPAPKPKGDGLEDLSYAELRELAAKREVEVSGRKKDDYITALRGYNRRDMRARG